ncbi:MAG TPA: hypothetical protein VGL46_25355 [Pseudonocardiaceae bacterium]|jgi:hypothetical protein
MGHDFCRHAEHTSIHAKRAPELNISRVGLHTDGRWRPGWRDGGVAFVVAFARDQYDPGMTVPGG